jgi:hypothetical protein
VKVRSTALGISVPDRLRSELERWILDGRKPQAGIPWPRDRWIAAFPAHEKLWASLPDRLARADVVAASSGAAANETKAVEAFMTSMAWGYGNVGYGPWRVQRCLSTGGASAKLFDAAQSLVSGGPTAGYAALGAQNRLTGLGPAFGTKYLYFVSKAASTPVALILDRLVASWLREHSGLSINPVPWHPPSYHRYLETVGAWANELGVAADDVELCIFRDVAAGGGQWAAA